MKKYVHFLWLIVFTLTATFLNAAESEEIFYIPQQLLEDMTGNKLIPDQEKTRRRLKGLEGLVVLVNASMDLKLQKTPLGRNIGIIKKEIADALTKEMVAAGIPVTGYQEWKKNTSKPIIRFNFTFYDANFNTLYVYCEDQYISPRNPDIYKYLEMWQDRDSFACDTLFSDDIETIRAGMLKSAKSVVSDFIGLYQEANPGNRSLISSIPESLSDAERDAVLEYMVNGDKEELKGLTCFLPVISIQDGRGGQLNPMSDKFFMISDKVIKRYQICLQRSKIPVTPVSRWEKDSVKPYLKIEMMMFDGNPMFNAVLYDKYILKRNPEQFEYCNIWGFNQSIKDENGTQAKAMKFLIDQSGRAFQEFARDYTIANSKDR